MERYAQHGRSTRIGRAMAESDFAVWDERNFDAEVLRQPGLAIVDFWSEGCVPCKQLTRVLTQIAAEIPQSVRIGTVKVNDNPQLAERFDVRAAPTLLFFKDGALVETRTGVDRRQVLKKLVEMHA
jgi:thioredoxin 1